MMWLPQQTIAQWLESVDALIALGPEHASLYILELYPNAPLRDAMARSKWSLAPDDDAADMYLEAMARLDAAGYEQYEISNVAQARTRVAAQPEILDRRRVAWLRLRRAFHPPRRPLEEPVVNDRVHRRCGVGRSARRRSVADLTPRRRWRKRCSPVCG